MPFAKPARTLETCLRLSKACGRPHSQSNVSKIIYFLLLEAIGISHTKGASEPVTEMTISKRCDVPSCFLFVAVAGHVCVCVCVREPVVCFCFEDGLTTVYVSTV